jgi:hypothetical protein
MREAMTETSSIAAGESAPASQRGHRALLVGTLLVACMAIGAALAAAINPAPSAHVRAESVVAVAVAKPEFQSVAWQTLGQVLGLAEVRAEIARGAGVEPSAVRIGTLGDPHGSLVTIYADGSSPNQADLLASTAMSVGLNFLRQTVYPAPITRSTFDASPEGWDLGTGIFVFAPSQLLQTRALGHAAAGAVTATCPAAGCGPYLVLDRAFRRATDYVAAGWVKAPTNTRLRIVLGSTPQDVAVGPAIAGTGRWRRLSATWTPQAKASRAVVTFQVVSLGASRFDVDDVEVGARGAIRTGASPVGAATYRVVSDPAVTGTLGAGDTAAWAAGGTVAGLLVGLAASAGAIAAARNRRREDEATGEEAP